jgi:hypothetical protein
MSEQFLKAIVGALGQHLAASIPELQQVIPEWPTANATLKYPSLTVITSGEARFVPLMSSQIAQGATDEDNQAPVRYLAGHWEPRLQLDLWCSSKPQRAEMFERVIKAMNPFPQVMGVRIRLNDYFDEWAGYTVAGYELLDGAEQAQRQEWRCVIKVDALCNAIFERTEYIMSQVVLTEEPTANYKEEF